MERPRTLTLPEWPQRGYWQFLYKYPSKYKDVEQNLCHLISPKCKNFGLMVVQETYDQSVRKLG
jgi:hypothetical protein